jgi:hypothetical protein
MGENYMKSKLILTMLLTGLTITVQASDGGIYLNAHKFFTENMCQGTCPIGQEKVTDDISLHFKKSKSEKTHIDAPHIVDHELDSKFALERLIQSDEMEIFFKAYKNHWQDINNKQK